MMETVSILRYNAIAKEEGRTVEGSPCRQRQDNADGRSQQNRGPLLLDEPQIFLAELWLASWGALRERVKCVPAHQMLCPLQQT
jgi:hypothetical protein